VADSWQLASLALASAAKGGIIKAWRPLAGAGGASGLAVIVHRGGNGIFG